MKISNLRELIDTSRDMLSVYPERDLHPLPHKGPRGHALERLGDFLAALVYRREVSGSETQGFRVPRDRIFDRSPDQSQEDAQKLTGIGFIPGAYSYDDKWLYELGQPDADDATIDRYGPGTVLVSLGYYVEQITIESVAASYPTVRGINEGIRYAMRLFTDSGILELKCPAYFDQIAMFSIVSGDGYSVDLAADAAGRRIAHLRVEMSVPEVALIDYRRMRVLVDYGPNGSNIRDGGVYPTLG